MIPITTLHQYIQLVRSQFNDLFQWMSCPFTVSCVSLPCVLCVPSLCLVCPFPVSRVSLHCVMCVPSLWLHCVLCVLSLGSCVSLHCVSCVCLHCVSLHCVLCVCPFAVSCVFAFTVSHVCVPSLCLLCMSLHCVLCCSFTVLYVCLIASPCRLRERRLSSYKDLMALARRPS